MMRLLRSEVFRFGVMVGCLMTGDWKEANRLV
jgi:hypothetical protein